VQYILAGVDSGSNETPAPVQQEMPTPVESAPTESATAPESTDFDLALGKEIYNTTCVACHAMGVAGSPKFGDKDAWAPRIAKGMDTLFTHALQGFQGKTGVMPPKGGRMDLPDDRVKAAVAYMVSQAQ